MHKKEVIPTLFALDKESFDKKLEKIKFSKKIHLDFMDSKFVPNKSTSISDMNSILNYPEIEFEIHLMAFEPEQYIGKIKKLNIKKVLIQFEAFETDTELTYSLECFREKELKIYLVINPGTELEDVYPYFNEVDGIMLMSVWPGKEGQKFIVNTLNRISEVRTKYPAISIQVDGGVNDSNSLQIITAGANILSIGSYISSDKNPKESFDKVIQIIK